MLTKENMRLERVTHTHTHTHTSKSSNKLDLVNIPKNYIKEKYIELVM